MSLLLPRPGIRCPKILAVILAVILGAAQFLALGLRAEDPTPGITVSEFMADSAGGLLDADGDASDWIELRNTSDAAISVDGYYLTDDSSQLTKWRLPDVTIAPDGYLVVFASSKDRADPATELHTNFSLSSSDYLALVAPDGVTVPCDFKPSIPRQFFGVSYGFGISGVLESEQLIATPAPVKWFVPTADIGESWQETDFDDGAWNAGETGVGYGYGAGFIGVGGDTRSAMIGINPGVYIRIPFQVSDPAAIVTLTLNIKFEDGFVAHLNGTRVASSDVPNPVLFNSAATSNGEVRDGDPFTNFALAFAGNLVAGENVLGIHLLNSSSSSSDLLVIPELVAETSDGNQLQGYFEDPTPGAPNSLIDYSGFVRDTTFDVDRGFYDTPFDVTVTTATPGATLVYTTDGNTPTLENGTSIAPPNADTPPQAAISIGSTTVLRAAAFKEGLRSTDVDTQTYLFLEDVLDQPADPVGYPIPWTARSGSSTADYEMDPNIVGPVYARDELKLALRSIPTISITTDIANLFDPQIGIQVNPQDSGEASEREVSVEMLDFEDGIPIQLNAGMRMNGNASRNPSRPKHNFRLTFRNEYGEGRLSFPLFGADAPADRFNSIILRGFNGDGWIHPSIWNRAQYTRDQWFRDAHTAMGYPEALQREVHVYFNGLYWGVHHLFERIEEEWSAERFGGVEDDWEGFRIVAGNNIEVIHGTIATWNETVARAASNDLDGIQEFIDLDSFIDYLLLNFYGGNDDWDQNNVRAMRQVDPPGKWMFFCHDAERAGLNSLSGATVNIDVTGKNTSNAPTQINTLLRTNPEDAIRFADRAHKHLFNGGALTSENGAALWRSRTDGIREALKAESARWGDAKTEPARTLVHWQASVDREFNEWFPQRKDILLTQLRNRGLYPDTVAPVFNQHGGAVPVGFPLQLTNDSGDIYYTMDGTDPRLPGGAVNPNAVVIPGSQEDFTSIPAGSSWKYLDDGTDLGTAWRAPDFDDSAWSEGQALLGFGGISTTPIQTAINVDRHTTIYFRKSINITGADRITEANLQLNIDDGAVVYINGNEALRDGLPGGVIDFDTFAPVNGNEGVFDTFPIDHTHFVDGENVIAVELHNRIGSSDMGFDLALEGERLSDANIPVTLNTTTQVRSRSLQNGAWSALNEATFITGVPASAGNLVISEIFYNPPGPAETTEYIELMNISDSAINLAGVSFTNGIQFQFADLTLGAGERVLLVADLAAFEAAFGSGLPVAGVFSGRLDNGGESLILSAADGAMIHNFRYNDRSPWPESADGGGFSLVLAAPQSDPAHANAVNWRPSISSGGSPGISDALAFSGDPGGDVDGNGVPDLLDYALVDAHATDVGMIDDMFLVSFPRNLAATGVTFTVEVSDKLQNWRKGEAVFLGYANQAGNTVDMVWRLDVSGEKAFARVVVALMP